MCHTNPGKGACAVESGWLLRNKRKVLVMTKIDGKIEFCELTEYDSKGLEGIQSSNYLMVGN